MKRVWKYGLSTPIIVPIDSRVVHFGAQDETAMVWIEMGQSKIEAEMRLKVFGTGHEIPDDAAYIGTIQDGPFVWHLYELNS